MVMPDWSLGRFRRGPSATLESNVPFESLARPLDRLAAAIIDIFILLVPLFVLVSAPLKRGMMMSFILGSEGEFVGIVATMIFLGVFVFVAYQSLCHYFWGATLGKRIFDLRVVPIFEGEKLHLGDHVLRSVLWIFELLAFGIPWLSVFSNPKRRPFHDRVCDTLVITRSPSGVKAPRPWERSLVRAVFATFIALFTLTLAIEIRGSIEKLKVDKTFAALVERDLGDCEVVDQSINSSDLDPHHRLRTAMSLYAAGLADRSCLEAEVEGEIARQVAVGPITYLAQAFIYADEADISNSYLDEVCDTAPGTVECSMSQLVTSWSDEDWTTVDDILKSAPKGSGYMEVWAVRHYMKQAQYQKALSALEELQRRRELAEFSLPLRVRALFNSFQESEAVAAYQQAALALPEEQSEELGSWMCAQQLQSGCEARETSPCRASLADGVTTEIDFERPSHALAHVLALECTNAEQVDYASFGEAVQNEDWRLFFAAASKRQTQDKMSSAELFVQLLKSSSAPEILRVEAARRLSQFASPSQMDDLIEEWSEYGPRESWVKIGHFLFSRLAEQKNSSLAMKVAQRLAAEDVLSPLAVKILAGWDSQKEPERRPASSRMGP